MPYADRAAQQEYQRTWAASRRAESLEGRVCEGCGTASSLEWHHLNPAEKVTHKIWSWSRPRRDAELAKCIPLCTECHKATTARQRRIEALGRNAHGTRPRYDLGCRCDPCREAKRVYNAAHPPRGKAA